MFWIFVVGFEVGRFMGWKGLLGGAVINITDKSLVDWLFLIVYISLAIYSVRSFKRDYLKRSE